MPATPGKLMYYYKDPYCKVPIFISGEATRCMLWIGGQAESFFTICYFEQLAAQLSGKWCFAQMELPSGHIGYGAQDHFCEAEDVDEVIGMLVRDYGMTEVALFATSTGTQVALQVLQTGNHAQYISRFVLHGIVCPIDNPLFTEAGIARRDAFVAALLKEGRKEDSLGMKGYYDIPVTPARVASGGYLSLQEALWQPALTGDTQTCYKALHHIKVPTLIMIANDSQYKPTNEELERVRKVAQESIACAPHDLEIEVFKDTCDELRRLLKADISSHVKAITIFLNEADVRRASMESESKQRAEEEARKKRIELNKLMCAA